MASEIILMEHMNLEFHLSLHLYDQVLFDVLYTLKNKP